MIANAICTPDAVELSRLSKARQRAGLGSVVPKSEKRKYVPSVIENATAMAQSIDHIMETFDENIDQIMPTQGFNVKKLQTGNLNFNVWDLGGQKAIR